MSSTSGMGSVLARIDNIDFDFRMLQSRHFIPSETFKLSLPIRFLGLLVG